MSNAARTERIKALSTLALAILRRCGERCNIDRAGRSCRLSEVVYNEFRLTRSRCDDEDQTSTLDVRFLGKVVLHVEWTIDMVLKTSYRPGEWEALLRRYERIPALAGRSSTLM
ncbi:hypothetical protein IVB36_38845 [Bradyrhizobium sp. 35]|uniref:hypothetical protein n=1 Tax=Bradyrhizobium sp. 35 TaxID=2782670 RepID=UPI001FF92D32|nr:hypothetical protein [Bradyrhizobium sp. 35]MCK1456684.1 hypothetical protein [Bradyrhizobium sp. 35]